MADEMISTQLIVAEKLVALLESGTEKLLLIDSRPFVEYNTSHILDAININCSKLMKRRLQQDKVLITELIQHSAKHKIEIDCKQEVVVYDQSSKDVTSLSPDCFLTVLLGKLEKNFISVCLLSGVSFSWPLYADHSLFSSAHSELKCRLSVQCKDDGWEQR